jgi:flagellar hook-associated protein 2
VVSDPTAGITITGSDGTAHQVSLTSGSAAAVAKSINAAGIGVRAAVINTDSGQVLQLSSTTTGASSSFTAGGFENPVNNITAAQDAKATVGDPANGGYSVSSSTNTFSNLIPGVTFSAGSLASNVSITVSSDPSAIAAKVQALVTAANAASSEMTNDSGQGAILQGQYDVRSIVLNVMSAVSKGTPSGASLKAYGIDMDKNGQMSFDPTAFQAAYTADPSGTKDAVAGGFATSLDTTTSNAVAPITGTITQAIASASTQSKNLSDEISKWTDRLADLQTSLTAKYSAMQTALAQLQSQQTYLTSMLKSLNGNSSSSSS